MNMLHTHTKYDIHVFLALRVFFELERLTLLLGMEIPSDPVGNPAHQPQSGTGIPRQNGYRIRGRGSPLC